ncbi:MAG: pyruvate kinase [Deltaproteobacteria bacterium]|nr:pyruvate kinase [Deltaproteobacteria bacterium]
MSSTLPRHKTKIVCTIGPACRERAILQKMILAGMNVARLNFSHGDLADHEKDIRTIKDLADRLGKPVAILADLPGPKIRIGELLGGSCILDKGREVVLTARNITGTSSQIPVQFPGFIKSIAKGSRIFLNDGFIQLKVLDIQDKDVTCRIITPGQLLSNKGMNLPDARLTVNPVTKRDLEFVEFGLKTGVDMFGVSFAKGPEDIAQVKKYAGRSGKKAFVLAKIERKEALERIDDILGIADAIMIARGDLGVEIPIEKVPTVQKQLILKANRCAKPVITATQMLESMTGNSRPTRAEVTDVANAILDGTDAVMLSEETAIGSYPVDAVKMLAKIARVTENQRDSIVTGTSIPDALRRAVEQKGASTEDMISLNVVNSLNTLNIRCVLVPAITGATARRISRFKDKTWIFAFCSDGFARMTLSLSYGVYPVVMPPGSSQEQMISYLKKNGFVRSDDTLIMVRGLPIDNIGRENSLKIIKLD